MPRNKDVVRPVELVDRQTFESFIVGPSTRLAHAAALTVAEEPGGIYNPLVLVGESGLGKTHLLQAIQARTLELFPEKRVEYKTGEDFTQEMIDSIGTHSLDQFKEKYRTADVLLIDDLQFLAGRENSQKEFCFVIDSLVREGNQVVVSSNRAPKDIVHLAERIQTRLETGLLVEVGPPDPEVKVAIVYHLAQQNYLDLPQEIIEYIASSTDGKPGQLKDIIKKLRCRKEWDHEEPTIDAAREACNWVVHEQEYKRSIEENTEILLYETALYYGVSVEELLYPFKFENPTKKMRHARQVAIYLLRTYYDYSVADLYNLFDLDWHLVFRILEIMEEELNACAEVKAEIEALKKKLCL